MFTAKYLPQGCDDDRNPTHVLFPSRYFVAISNSLISSLTYISPVELNLSIQEQGRSAMEPTSAK